MALSSDTDRPTSTTEGIVSASRSRRGTINSRAGSNIKVSTYQAKLSSISPGFTIDRLKGDITTYLKQNVELCDALKKTDDYIFKKRGEIAKIVEKYDAACVHRNEHFRDLSSFEFNFAKRKGYELRNTIDCLNVRITGALSDLRTQTVKQQSRTKYLLSEE